VDQLAPAAIGVAPGFSAAGQEAIRIHSGVFSTFSGRSVQFAPAHVENLADGVGIGLTAGTIRTRNRGTVGQMIRHGPSREAIAVTRLGPATTPQAFAI
jgi:hypothetical protein